MSAEQCMFQACFPVTRFTLESWSGSHCRAIHRHNARMSHLFTCHWYCRTGPVASDLYGTEDVLLCLSFGLVGFTEGYNIIGYRGPITLHMICIWWLFRPINIVYVIERQIQKSAWLWFGFGEFTAHRNGYTAPKYLTMTLVRLVLQQQWNCIRWYNVIDVTVTQCKK